MKMVPRIVGIRMSIPPTLPGVSLVYLSIVDFEVVVRIPANTLARLSYRSGIVDGFERDGRFEMTAFIPYRGLGNLIDGLETRQEGLQNRPVDISGACAAAGWRPLPRC